MLHKRGGQYISSLPSSRTYLRHLSVDFSRLVVILLCQCRRQPSLAFIHAIAQKTRFASQQNNSRTKKLPQNYSTQYKQRFHEPRQARWTRAIKDLKNLSACGAVELLNRRACPLAHFTSNSARGHTGAGSKNAHQVPRRVESSRQRNPSTRTISYLDLLPYHPEDTTPPLN